jgi:hypothetical protein
LPDGQAFQGLQEDLGELKSFFEAGGMTADRESIQDLLRRFEEFRDRYIRVYVEAHQKARSGEQFRPYEQIRQSRRYQLLEKLDQLEMISVRHDFNLVNNLLSGVIFSKCEFEALALLQNSPVCRCGFELTQENRFTPVREIEAAIDLGIRETLEALGSATYQEKLLPFIKGLEDVGETKKAEAVRRLLAVTSVRDADLIPALEQALNPLAVQGVNEAFRGRVVVVGRDLDQLYQALVRRKYTLAQTQKIFREWLKEEEISPSTFIHFLGREEAGGEASPVKERFPAFVEAHFQHLLPLLREAGPTPFKQALLISFWLEGYGLAAQKAAALFPFLEKMEPDKAVYSVAQLKRAAGLLAEKEPVLFEKIIEEVEKGEGFSAGIWRLLEEETAAAIFQKETLFSSILGEAFERLLASPEGIKPMEWPLPEAPPERQAPTAAFLAEKKRMAEVLKDCEIIRQKLQLLKRREGNPPRDFKPWESLYIQHLSPLAYLLGTVPNRLERMGKGLPSIVRENIAEGKKICRLLFELFSRFYRQSLAGWEEGAGKRPRLVEDLPGRSLIRGLLPEGKEGIFLLLDGMRWDLWEYLKEKFFAPLADQFRILQEGALWAHAPSSTSRQMEFFERALKEAGESGRGPEFRFWKFGGLDERVHTEKGSIEHLFGNVLQHLQLELAPSLRQRPPQTPLIVFSDHGFIENPHFEKSDKYRTPRYIHGESSPLEIIVPWAALVKM